MLMKQKLLLLMTLALMGWSNVWAAEGDAADWYLYFYSGTYSLDGDAGQFKETATANVYTLEGVSVPGSGISFCVRNSSWSKYGWKDASVTTTGTPVGLAASESANGWLALDAGTYDVTWDATNLTIQFDVHEDTDLSDWYLYLYKEAAIDGNTQFHTTSTEHVFIIEGLRLEETNVNLSVHNSDWSSKYSADVTTAGSATALPTSESASGTLYIGTGIYDVTWNESTCEITFTKRSYPDYIYIEAYRGDAYTSIGYISPLNQDFGTYRGQFNMNANEKFRIMTRTGEVYSAYLYTNASNGIVEFASGTTWDMWATATAGIHTFEFDLTESSNVWSCTYAGTATITIGSAGYATFYSDWDYDVPEGLTGYIIPNVTDGTLNLESRYAAGNEVPAGTGVLYAGSAGSYEVTFKSTQSSAYTNRLGGSHFATTVNTWVGEDSKNVLLYKLAKDATYGLGWYFDSADGQSLNCGANKCYLWLTQTEAGYASFGTRGFIGFGDGTTAIESVVKKAEINDGVYYNLQGQRVDNPTKGLYIHNGKKVVIK